MEGVSYESQPKKREDIRLEKIGLEIPKASEYEEFVTRIKENEQKFLSKLNL